MNDAAPLLAQLAAALVTGAALLAALRSADLSLLARAWARARKNWRMTEEHTDRSAGFPFAEI
jgi:hypothetical protein